jgi:phospholipid-binding lipoprotein MlaA
MRPFVTLFGVLMVFCLEAHAQDKKNNIITDSDLSNNSTVDDPYESWNRAIFGFNNTLDTYLLEPVSIGYDVVTPETVKLLIRNELDYIQSPVSIVNSMLQGNLDVMLHTTGRFLINTTFGGLGLLDAASGFGLKPHQEDFGQTLAVWGVSDGGYYVMPFLGSTTFRDLGGRITDFAFTPTTYITDDIVYVSAGVTALGVIDFRDSNSEFINNLKASSSDYYSVVKTIYMQRRNSDIKNATFVSENTREPEFIDFDE